MLQSYNIHYYVNIGHGFVVSGHDTHISTRGPARLPEARQSKSDNIGHLATLENNDYVRRGGHAREVLPKSKM
jgi:hypothetical protein